MNNLYSLSLLVLFLLASCTGNRKVQVHNFISPSFNSDIASFGNYRYPDWFRDSKFGIWAHWGPQAVPRQGDWYARKMYESDIYDRSTNKPTGKPSKEYLYHLEHYGHPSRFGYKDIIPLWK